MNDNNTQRRRVMPNVQNNQPNQQSRPARSWAMRGDQGFKQSEILAEQKVKEQEARQAINSKPFPPFRYALPKNGEGQMIILDNSVDDIIFASEHSLWDGVKRKYMNYLCTAELSNACPICDGSTNAENTNPYFGMYMSVLDSRTSLS